MLELVAALVAAGVGIVVGVALHELAHYLVLWVAGASPRLVWPDRTGFQFRPGVAFPARESAAVRVSAAAPIGAALVHGCVLYLMLPATTWAVSFAITSVLWCAKLSPSDRRVIRRGAVG